MLAPRASLALSRAGIQRAIQIEGMTDAQLLALPQFGKKALAQTHAFLAEHAEAAA